MKLSCGSRCSENDKKNCCFYCDVPEGCDGGCATKGTSTKLVYNPIHGVKVPQCHVHREEVKFLEESGEGEI